MGAFVALNQQTVSQKILGAPKPLLAKRSTPKPVRFELVETPASAETTEPPKNSNLMSDKSTRAQDRFQSEKKLKDSPHMEGKHEDVKDTRPRNLVSEPPAKPKAEPTPERTAEAPPREPPKKAEPPKEAPKEQTPEPSEPEESIEVAPEPKEDVIRLAKKTPDPSEPIMPDTPPMASRMISAASASNAAADAQITGELSFAASRHFFGEYLLKMKQAIERQWISRLVSQYTGIVSSKAVVEFKIQPDGRVTDVVVESVDGDPYFRLICVSSIKDAQPFDAIPYDAADGLPERFMDKPLNIRFTFRYN